MVEIPNDADKSAPESQAEAFFRQKNAKSAAIGMALIASAGMEAFASFGYGETLFVALSAAIVTFVLAGFKSTAERVSGLALAAAFVWYFWPNWQ